MVTALTYKRPLHNHWWSYHMGGGIEGELKINNLEKLSIPKITVKQSLSLLLKREVYVFSFILE